MQALGIRKVRLIKNVGVLRFIVQGNKRAFRQCTKEDCGKMIVEIDGNKKYALGPKQTTKQL